MYFLTTHGMTFESEYFCEFEFIFENNLGSESGDQADSFDESLPPLQYSGLLKLNFLNIAYGSCDTVPLNLKCKFYEPPVRSCLHTLDEIYCVTYFHSF